VNNSLQLYIGEDPVDDSERSHTAEQDGSNNSPRKEIAAVWERIQKFLADVDSGKLATF